MLILVACIRKYTGIGVRIERQNEGAVGDDARSLVIAIELILSSLPVSIATHSGTTIVAAENINLLVLVVAGGILLTIGGGNLQVIIKGGWHSSLSSGAEGGTLLDSASIFRTTDIIRVDILVGQQRHLSHLKI